MRRALLYGLGPRARALGESTRRRRPAAAADEDVPGPGYLAAGEGLRVFRVDGSTGGIRFDRGHTTEPYDASKDVIEYNLYSPGLFPTFTTT